MANEEHLKILKQGSGVWNQWRQQNPEINPDLSDANIFRSLLSGANFSGANFSGADLRGATLTGPDFLGANYRGANFSGADLKAADLSAAGLSGSDFSGADLSSADLFGADLSSADLTNAYLFRVDLSNVDLRAAILTGASLIGANLARANLADVDLMGVTIGGTNFGDIDLSMVKNLDWVNHYGPSTIGIDTLYKSEGRIPEAFLRGCGVPDDYITFVPSLIGSPKSFSFYSCFISYSTKDEEFAKRLHSRLRDEKLRVWFAPEDVKGGEKLYEQIERAIQVHDRLLIVLSENSMKSEWVMTELRKARQVEKKDNRRKLFPIRLVDFDTIRAWKCFDADSGKDLAVEIREYFIPDFSNWKDHDSFEAGFKRLLKDLRAAES